jgi:hypothetical protein
MYMHMWYTCMSIVCIQLVQAKKASTYYNNINTHITRGHESSKECMAEVLTRKLEPAVPA